MRLFLIAWLLALAPAAQAAAQAAADVGVAAEAGPGPLTPWLVLASIALVVTLFAAQWLVNRGPRR